MILEPDGLGIIPFNIDINGTAEWCQPRDAAGNPQPGATPEDRYSALNYAVDVLSSLQNVRVYSMAPTAPGSVLATSPIVSSRPASSVRTASM